jgi:hypothetical protein
VAVSRALRRLLHILDMEEEQRRVALESALGELRQLENAMDRAAERDRQGRRLVALSAANGELADRQAGLEETLAAGRRERALRPWIVEAKGDVEELREEFLAKRIERRQAETLIEAAEARNAAETARRGQQSLDDWYLNRFGDSRSTPGPGEPDRTGAGPQKPRAGAGET